MKDKLQTIIKKILKTLKDEWLFTLIIVLLIADATHQYFALQTYNQNNDVIQYKKLSAIIDSSETNNSVESMQITELLSQIDKTTKVYMIKEGKDKLYILAQENNRTMLVKHMPSISMTFTLEPKLLDKQIDYEWVEKKEKPKAYVSKILDANILNLLLLGGLIYFLVMTSGVKLFQKEFSGRNPGEIEGDFSDLIGYEEIKTEAIQLLQIISKNDRYAQYGIDGTFNILFSGKPGTGKSKFALYLAKELDIPIVSSTGSLDEVYVGTGAKKIRNLFKEANKRAELSEHHSCIVFIDEGQNLLRKRGQGSDNKWEDDTSNELLAHLDGVQKNQKYNIIVIIASNFHEGYMQMDEAMMRRFKKKIHFREPNLKERKAILEHYLENIEMKEENIDITYLAKNMSGLTPASIESVVQEAGLISLREENRVSTDVLLKAFERTVVGQSSRAVTQGQEKVRKTIAVHEIGHFLVEYHRAVLGGGDLVQIKELTHILKISSEAVSQRGALGFTMKEQQEGALLQNIEDMEWELRQLYGGLAAEQTVYGKSGITTGSSDDIEKATYLLEHMINQNNVYGTAKLNYEALGAKEKRVTLLEEKSQSLFEESMEIIQKYEDLLGYLSGVLLKEWSLSKDEIFEHIAIYTNESGYALKTNEH